MRGEQDVSDSHTKNRFKNCLNVLHILKLDDKILHCFNGPVNVSKKKNPSKT